MINKVSIRKVFQPSHLKELIKKVLPQDRLKKTVKKLFHPNYIKAGLSISIAIISYLVKYSCNVFLARHLASGLFGDFTTSLRTFLLAASLLPLGTSTSAKKYLSLYLRTDRPEKVISYIAWNIKIIAKSSFNYMVFLSVFTLIVVSLHFTELRQFRDFHLTLYLLFLAPIGAINFLIISYLHSNNNIYWQMWLNNTARPILFIAFIAIAIYFVELDVGSQELWVMVLISYVLLCLIEGGLLYFKMPMHIFSSVYQQLKKPFTPNRAWEITAHKLALSQLAYLLITVLDLYLIKIISNENHGLDIYSAILTICGVIFLVSVSIFQFITPTISHAMEKKDCPDLQNSISQANLFNLTAMLVIFLVIVFYGQTILAHFGRRYASNHAYATLIILSIGMIINSFARSAVLVLSYSHLQSSLLKITIIEIIVLLILGSILTYYYGIMGTAIATSIAMTYRAIALIVTAALKTHVNPARIFMSNK